MRPDFSLSNYNYLLLKIFKKETPKILIDLKDNLMWGAILRVVLQAYSKLIYEDLIAI